MILRILVQYDTMGDLILLLGQCDLYHGPVILLNTILWIYIILQILVQYDTMSELILLIGQCDLYFMVQ